jgi:hypothetical protein
VRLVVVPERGGGGLGYGAWQLWGGLRWGGGCGVRFGHGSTVGREIDFGDPPRQLTITCYFNIDFWIVVWVVCPGVRKMIVKAFAAQ